MFLDGFGLGSGDPAQNPAAAANTPTIARLLGGPLTSGVPARSAPKLTFRPISATLGVGGLPQSATGQAALLTGVNAAKLMGRHYGPWPGPTLAPLLASGTVFHHAERLGGAALANAYPPGYFEALHRGRIKPSSNVLAAREAGVRLRDMNDYERGLAVAADLAGEHFAALGRGYRTQTPDEAAAALATITGSAALTFFDLWLTDTLGHARDHGEGQRLLERFDALLAGLLVRGAGEAFTLVVTSDHGNLEDLGSGAHTLNPVPLLVIGDGAPGFAGARSLLDVAPALNRHMSGNR